MPSALILTDGRPGHEAQSRAFCEIKGLKYDICRVKYRYKIVKLLSYILDFMGVYLPIFSYIFEGQSGDNSGDDFGKGGQNGGKIEAKNSDFSRVGSGQNGYKIIIAAGSATYYPLKYFARKMGAMSVAMMQPKGYKNDFKLTFMQLHDAPKTPPKNAILLPVNICAAKKGGFYEPSSEAISFIIGGPNRNFSFNEGLILKQLKQIFALYPSHLKLITTSPRTPKGLENELKNAFKWDFAVFFSENKINPIGDFLEKSEAVFITSDSTSMISEAACYGVASVSILGEIPPIKSKIGRFLEHLKKGQNITVFDGKMAGKTAKIDLVKILNEVRL